MTAVGTDISPLAIEVCKLRGLHVPLCLAINDLGSSFPADCFDSIILMFHNFGLLGGFQEARKPLQDLHGITSPGGRIIASIADPYSTTDPLHLNYHKLNLSRGRMAGQLRFRIRYRDIINPWMDYLFISEDELRNIVAGTGWHIGEIISPKKVYLEKSDYLNHFHGHFPGPVGWMWREKPPTEIPDGGFPTLPRDRYPG